MDVEVDRFGGTALQRRPKGGYWLPKEFHTWPEVRASGLAAVGAFVSVGIWAARFNTTAISKGSVRGSGADGSVSVLVERGLWEAVGPKEWRTKTMEELRAGRGSRGLVMRLSQMLSRSMSTTDAGNAAFGLWVLAASWSLTTETPGYVPTDQALTLGKAKHVAALWDSGLWLATEHGFLMNKGADLFEARWDLSRDDERAEIPPDLRLAIYERDGWRCLKCESPDDLTLDHIIPWSHGGPDTYENLRTLCRPCNSSKGARAE
jgi:hypothetical protein